jgi:probable selenium-dependent hydroxylase accessory protein YqeC
MGSLSAWFENLLFLNDSHAKARVVAVIGSGGKTSLIWHLAASLKSDRKILVTPTTKMLVPASETKLYDKYCNGTPPDSVPGVTLAGTYNETIGKLESLAFKELSKITSSYDLVLLEADGAKGLPLKAWSEDEPVIPSFTTMTIGVLPIWPLGKPVSEKLIHRLPLFLELTGASAGDILKPEHIAALITGKADEAGGKGFPGLFTKALGKKVLFFNQVEDDSTLERARELTKRLPSEFHEVLSGIVAGYIQKDWLEEL